MTYIERITATLREFGVEQDNFGKMILEWHYTGQNFDLEESIESCDLCSHPRIRYQFEIRNHLTEHSLLIGSDCIQNEGFRTTDNNGNTLSASDSLQIFKRDYYTLVQLAKQRRAIQAMKELSLMDTEYNIQSFIGDYLRRGAFTPKQLRLIFVRLWTHRLDFNRADFKLTIKRRREKKQLLSMTYWKVKKLWKSMSAYQRGVYMKRRGNPYAY